VRTSGPKHARRADSISDAGDMPESYNKITTKPESSFSLVTLFFYFKKVNFRSGINIILKKLSHCVFCKIRLFCEGMSE